MYSDITSEFIDKFPRQWMKLEEVRDDIRWNQEVAVALKDAGRHDTAERILRCHSRLVSNDPKQLQAEKYCKQLLFCKHCARLRSVQRANRLLLSCQAFGERINSRKLILHQYVISPDKKSTSDPSYAGFVQAVAQIKRFRELLNVEHKRRKQIFERSDDRKAKWDVWGPTFNSLHVVPAYAGFNKSPYAHCHLTIVTYQRNPKGDATNTVRKLWQQVISEFGGLNRKAVDEVEHRRRKTEESRYSSQMRFGEFSIDPDEKNCVNLDETISHMRYLSHGIKTRWDGETVVNHAKLLEKVGVNQRELQQVLGSEGIKIDPMPDEFNFERLKQRYVADWNFKSERWVIRKGVYRKAD